MSNLSLVQIRPDEECFLCKETFTEDDYRNGNPPMKHEGLGLLHDAGHKLCWRGVVQHKNECPFCKDPLNYSSLFSWAERVQDVPRKFIANALITGITGIATQAGIAAIGASELFPAQGLRQALAGMAIGTIAPQPVALFGTLQGLAGSVVAAAMGDPGVAFECGTVAIGLASSFIASKVPGADKTAVLGGLASAVVLTGLGASALPALLVGGAIAGTLAVWRRLSGATL